MTEAFSTVGIYAALNTFILFWLVVATSLLRKRYHVLIGDGGVAHLTRIMRGHANAIENIPMTIILLVIAAAMGTPTAVLHVLGLVFTIGRAIHAWHFIQEDGAAWQRAVGFGLGAVVTVATALGVLGHALWQIF